MDNFKDYSVFVSGSKGLTDLPKAKTPLTVDWPDRSGKYIDTVGMVYQPREITLDCFVIAGGYTDFVRKCDNFTRLFRNNAGSLNYIRLTLDNTMAGTLHLFVYLNGGIAFNKNWNEVKMFGTFSLKLTEPEPIGKAVCYEVRQGSAITATVDNGTHLFRYCLMKELTNDTSTIAWTYNQFGSQNITIENTNGDISRQWLVVFGDNITYSDQ